MNYKRRIQLLFTGEPDRLSQSDYRHYVGIDMGVRTPSVAVVGHMEDDVFHVDLVRSWQSMDFDTHEAVVAGNMDAYNIRRGWTDDYQSAALVRRFQPIVQVKLTKRTRRQVHRMCAAMVKANLIRPVSYHIAGKPPDYFARIVEQVGITDSEIEIDADKDQYTAALKLAVWGTSQTEPATSSERLHAAFHFQR